MQLTAVLTRAEKDRFIALNSETGTIIQGETINETLSTWQDATELYLEKLPLAAHGHLRATTFDIPAHA